MDLSGLERRPLRFLVTKLYDSDFVKVGQARHPVIGISDMRNVYVVERLQDIRAGTDTPFCRREVSCPPLLNSLRTHDSQGEVGEIEEDRHIGRLCGDSHRSLVDCLKFINGVKKRPV